MKYLNNQKYYECQLITLWNVAIFWGLGKLVPKQFSKNYKRICDRARCMYGSVIDKEFEIKRLNLKAIIGKYNLKWIKYNLPVELSIFCHRGYHSVLIVGIVDKNIILANYARNRLHKISFIKLFKKVNKHLKPISWKLKKKK